MKKLLSAFLLIFIFLCASACNFVLDSSEEQEESSESKIDKISESDKQSEETEEEKSNDILIYELSADGTYYIVVGLSEQTDVLCIPATHEGKPVKKIAESAFRACETLTRVKISDTLTNIGDKAFEYCSNLLSVTLGKNVKSIGLSAFYGCYKMMEVVNYSSLTLSVGDTTYGLVAFYAEDVHSGESKLAETGDYLFYAFDGINYLVDYSGDSAEVCLPENFNGEEYLIGKYAFNQKNITGIRIPFGIQEIGEAAFRGCRGLENILLPDSVKRIENYAFESCVNLASITMPKGLKHIGAGAFWGCQKITSITIPSTVEEIGGSAFNGCIRLVEAINHSSSQVDCEYLLETHRGASKVVNSEDFLFYTVGEENHYLIDYLGTQTEIVLPAAYNGERYKIYKNAFYYRDDITRVTISDSVTNIGDHAFFSCSNLVSVTVGESVTGIGFEAFSWCFKLVEVINKSSLPLAKKSEGDFANNTYGDIAMYALEVHNGESKLVEENGYLFYIYEGKNYVLGYVGHDTALVLPATYNGEKYEIYNHAFYSRDDITSVAMPDAVTNIGDYAFEYCTGLTSVTIGNSVTSIGAFAFKDCTSLTSIDVDAENAYYSSLDGNLYDKNQTMLIQYAVGKKATLFDIPDSVTSIGDYAFYYCENLMSVIIGDSVTSIGIEAFSGCDNLMSVTVGEAVTGIGYKSFANCKRLTSVYYFGTEEKRDEIYVDDNQDFFQAIWYYYSENKPTDEGDYWHYDNEGNIVVWGA